MADDIRLARWDLVASAGTTQRLIFTASETLTSLAVYVGGTTSDVDDLTGATAYGATLTTTTVANDTATVDVAVPISTVGSQPIRLVIDAAVAAVGTLTPSTSGTASQDNTITLTADTRSYTLTLGGIVTVDGLADAVTLAGTQTLTNKTLNSFTNVVEADSLHRQVRNSSGALIPKGSPVYQSGFHLGSELIEVALADASSTATMPAVGVTTEDIDNNASGNIDVIGRVTDLDTSAYVESQVLYVSETPGAYATAPPLDLALVQPIATVLRSHATNGKIAVTARGVLPSATETDAGILRLATAADITAGTNTTKAITPAQLAAIEARVAALEASAVTVE